MQMPAKSHKRRRSIEFTSSSESEEDEPKPKVSKSSPSLRTAKQSETSSEPTVHSVYGPVFACTLVSVFGYPLGLTAHPPPLVRDTSGTALYFLEYDAMRHMLGRKPSGKQGPVPSWVPVHVSLIPFLCGSLAGVTSWALIYPIDVYVQSPSFSFISLRNYPSYSVKTKMQQRALAEIPYRGVTETFFRLVRGPDPAAPKPLLLGLARLYRGLGVSALRSVLTHGVLWTLFDSVGHWIDTLPRHGAASEERLV